MEQDVAYNERQRLFFEKKRLDKESKKLSNQKPGMDPEEYAQRRAEIRAKAEEIRQRNLKAGGTEGNFTRRKSRVNVKALKERKQMLEAKVKEMTKNKEHHAKITELTNEIADIDSQLRNRANFIKLQIEGPEIRRHAEEIANSQRERILDLGEEAGDAFSDEGTDFIKKFLEENKGK